MLSDQSVDASLNLGLNSLVAQVEDALGDEGADLLELLSVEAASGACSGAHADAGGDEGGTGLVGDGVLVPEPVICPKDALFPTRTPSTSRAVPNEALP